MHSIVIARARAAVSLLFVSALAAGCAGGGTGPSLTRTSPVSGTPATASPQAPEQQAHATFIITWPSASSTTAARRRPVASLGTRKPNYLSPSTASITIAVNGGTPIDVDNPNITSSGASPSPTTTQIVSAPAGNDTFTVNDFDKTGGAGNLLAANSISYTIVAGEPNVVPITLNGNLAKVACSPVAPFTSGTAPAFTIVGPAGQVAIVAEDADSNIIVAPGVVPPVTLTADATKAIVTTTSTPNTFVVNPLAVGTAVTLSATGMTDAGMPVTTTCTATRVLAMYIANHYEDNQGSSSATGAPFASSASITIYPVTAASGDAPTATISGPATLLTEVQFPLVDNNGNLFVSNQGPMPGQPYGLKSGFVTIYGPATHDNTAPMYTIANLGEPQGLAFDSKGALYVSELDRVEEYPASANGVRGAAVPSNTITGPATDLGCYGIALDATDGLYMACAVAMLYFPPGSTGNQAPGIVGAVGTVVAGSTTLTTTESWMGVSVDSSGNFALPGWNNNANQVSVYPPSDIPSPGAGFATPIPTLAKDLNFSQPFGIAVDPNGQYYVTNFGSSTVNVFTSLTTMEAGLGSNLTLGGVDKPYGITVR